MARPIYILTNSEGVFPFLHILSSIFICRLTDGHTDQCEVVPHYGFDLHFSNNYDITYMWNLKYGINEPIYKTETVDGLAQWLSDIQISRSVLSKAWVTNLGSLTFIFQDMNINL